MRYFLILLFHRRYYFLCGFLAVFLYSLYYSGQFHTVYEAKVKIVSVNQAKSRQSRDKLQTLFKQPIVLNSDFGLAEDIKLMQGLEFSKQFVLNHHLLESLADDYHYDDRGARILNDRRPFTLDRAAISFRHHLRVSLNGQSGIVEIKLIWPNQDEVAPLVNALIADLNQSLRDEESQRLQRNADLLRERLASVGNAEVKNLIADEIENSYSQRMLLATSDHPAYSIIDQASRPSHPVRHSYVMDGVREAIGYSRLFFVCFCLIELFIKRHSVIKILSNKVNFSRLTH